MLLSAVESRQQWLRLQDEAEEGARTTLLAEYRRLVRVELPAAAVAGGWVIWRDHCFARVILDAVCGGCWYAHLRRQHGRSAESRLDAAQLAKALQTGRGMLTGGMVEVSRINAQSLSVISITEATVGKMVEVSRINAQSLRWRGKN